MTFAELAKAVAEIIKEDMEDGGYKTFAEMKQSYWWEAEDIKDYINDLVTFIAREQMIECWVSDDRTFVQIGWTDMSWRDFKKLVFSGIK